MSKTSDCDLNPLIELMAKLRDPDTGCPWDLRQDFHSIAPYTIEEAYEVADAINRDDINQLKDELGDLLFHVVFHARMAQEQGSFDIADVVSAIVGKMIRRHPHVFATTEPGQTTNLETSWEEIKAAERIATGKNSESLMDGLAVGLPGLQRAVKLQKKAARCGFDWLEIKPVLAKLHEEIAELEEAMGQVGKDARAAIRSELGDVLFSVVNLARHLEVDAELCLAAANGRFERRFRTMESLQDSHNGGLAALNSAELERLWEMAKEREARAGHNAPG